MSPQAIPTEPTIEMRCACGYDRNCKPRQVTGCEQLRLSGGSSGLGLDRNASVVVTSDSTKQIFVRSVA